MINAFNNAIKELLRQKAGIDIKAVDVSFETPTHEWSAPVTRPTINIYLYDVRENRELRENYWDEEPISNGRYKEVRLKRRPLRVDLSYMITCWVKDVEQQNMLLWRVLETLFRYSPIPEDMLQGRLKELSEAGKIHPIRTEVAQPEGVFKNVAEFWGALDNQLRPGISLVATLDLELEPTEAYPLVFDTVVRYGQPEYKPVDNGRSYQLQTKLAPGWEGMLQDIGGVVREADRESAPDKKSGKREIIYGSPIVGAAVRLTHVREGRSEQVGPTILTDKKGRYVLRGAPPGEYTLVVEANGQVIQETLNIAAPPERGEVPPEILREIIVPLNK